MNNSARPNILIFLADQHRADCLGAYGNPDVQTPHLDNLACDGVTYRNSFCPYPICTPSRYSLLSGLYVHQHLGWSNVATLPPGIDAFPKLLRRAGYRTKAVGKMHFTPTYLDVGFDDMELAEQFGGGRFEDDYHRYLRDKGLVDSNDLIDQEKEYRGKAPPEYWDTCGAMESNLSQEDHSTSWIAQRALAELNRWQGGANLLMVGFIKPHHPFDPPAPWSRMYDPEQLSILPGWTPECLPWDLARHGGYFPHQQLTEARLRRIMAMYYATISQIDHQIGRMIGLLREKGLYDSTLILYTADHGDYMGFHHMILKGNHMYDPLMRVPLIIKYPGGHVRGAASETMVNNVDLAPTLLAQANVAPGRAMPGRNLLNCEIEPEFAFAESDRTYMVRSRTAKLLLSAQAGRSLFFDLIKDPLEMKNLFDQPERQAEIKTYRQTLADWMLFQTPTPPYLDRHAPMIQRPNTPPPNLAEELQHYFRQRMAD